MSPTLQLFLNYLSYLYSCFFFSSYGSQIDYLKCFCIFMCIGILVPTYQRSLRCLISLDRKSICCYFCLVIFYYIQIRFLYCQWLLYNLFIYVFSCSPFCYFYLAIAFSSSVLCSLSLFSSTIYLTFLWCQSLVSMQGITSSGCLLTSCLLIFDINLRCQILRAYFSYIYIYCGVIFMNDYQTLGFIKFYRDSGSYETFNCPFIMFYTICPLISQIFVSLELVFQSCCLKNQRILMFCSYYSYSCVSLLAGIDFLSPFLFYLAVKFFGSFLSIWFR